MLIICYISFEKFCWVYFDYRCFVQIICQFFFSTVPTEKPCITQRMLERALLINAEQTYSVNVQCRINNGTIFERTLASLQRWRKDPCDVRIDYVISSCVSFFFQLSRNQTLLLLMISRNQRHVQKCPKVTAGKRVLFRILFVFNPLTN